MKTVLVFGTFDGLDRGHRYFLEEAATHGDRLVVAVARDAHVHALKQKSPLQGEEQRLAQIRDVELVSDARLSDPELGTYQVLDDVQPDIVVLGHDQLALADDLRRWMESHLAIPLTFVGKYA